MVGVAPGQDDLFFSGIVDSYVNNPRFLRREWLAAEVDGMLKADYRFLLITASPGAGKSAFIAQLANEHPKWPVYFIRRDQRTPLSDVGPHSFLLRIGYQLSALYPELFTPEAIKLVVEQRVRSVDASGEAVGAEVKRLIASPFHQQIVRIRQEVERNQGNVIGLRIGEWVVDPRLIPLSDLQYLALIDPARSLATQRPNETIVILVDALDELRYHQSDQTLLQWLSNCPQLPSNVRFVLTSRPLDEMLMAFTDKQQPYLQTLRLETKKDEVVKDLERYIDHLVGESAVAASLAQAGQDVKKFSAVAVEKANDSIGYLDALARGIDQSLASGNHQSVKELLSLQSLPDHLEGLYAFFLRQVHASVEKQSVEVEDSDDVHYLPAWPAVYKRILGILSVARVPQTIKGIKQLGGIVANEDYVLHAVSQLLQFVQIVDGHYRFYHSTVGEFLTAPETRANSESAAFYVDPVQWNGRIANYYWKPGEAKWTACDDYGLNYLATHLFEGQQGDRLQKLISKEWMQSRYEAGHDTHTGFLSDIDLAWRAVLADKDPSWPLLVRLQTARQVGYQQVSTYTDVDLQTLVWLGRAGTARAHARLRSDADGRFDALLTVYRALKEKGEPDAELLSEARDEANAVYDIGTRVRVLCELGVELFAVGAGGAIELLEEALAASSQPSPNAIEALRADQVKAEALKDLGLAFAIVGDARADEIFQQTRKAAESLDDDPDRIAAPQAPALRDLSQALSRTGRFDEAEQVAGSISYSDWEADAAYKELGQRLAESGRLADAERMIGYIHGSLTRVQALTGLTLILHKKGDPYYNDVLAQAHEAISGITFDGHRLAALSTVAATMAEVNDNRADQFFEDARTLAKNMQNVKAGSIDATSVSSWLQYLVSALMRAGRHAEALDFNRSIGLFKRVETLRNMALTLARKADGAAHQVFDEALAEAEQTQVNWPYASSALAITLARFSYAGQAREVFNTIDLSAVTPIQLSELAEALARIGAFSEAEKAARAITYRESQDGAYRKVSVVLAHSKNWDEAQRLIGLIQDSKERLLALSALAAGLACSGDVRADSFFPEIVRLAETNSQSGGNELSEAASVFARSRCYAQAMQLARATKDIWSQAQIFKALAAIAIEAADTDEAIEAATSILNPYWQAASLQSVTATLARTGKIDRAFEVANSIGRKENPSWYGTALQEVASALARINDPRSRALFREAQEQLNLIAEMDQRSERLQALASIMAAVADDGATEVFSAAYDAARGCNQSEQKVRALTNLAVSMSAAKHPRTGEVFAEARTTAAAVVGRGLLGRDGALQKVAEGLAAAGRHDEALTTSAAIQDTFSKPTALSQIAISLARAGDPRAAQAFADARAEANRISTDSTRDDRLKEMARAQADVGLFKEALTTLGPRKLYYFVLAIADWAPNYERREPGLLLQMLQEVTNVAGWLQPDWRSLETAISIRSRSQPL